MLRDAPFDIWGRGARLKLKKIVSRHKSQKKKVCWKCKQKKKFVVEIDEKYVDQKKHQMVTYIIGKAYDKKFCDKTYKKKLSDVDIAKKKLVFHRRWKKKFASNKNSSAPPPQISNGASLMGSVSGARTVQLHLAHCYSCGDNTGEMPGLSSLLI